MPIERFACLATGAGILLALAVVGAHRLPPGWDAAAHFASFALVTALLWRGTAGRAPLVVLGSVLAFSVLEELHRQVAPERAAGILDFIADATAALAVTGVLFIRRKTLCAESSEP